MELHRAAQGVGRFPAGRRLRGVEGHAALGDHPEHERPVELYSPATPGLPSINARRPNPSITRGVAGDKSIGNSTYHSLQVRGDRRLAGVTSLTAYTWSKCMSGPNDIGGRYRRRLVYRQHPGHVQLHQRAVDLRHGRDERFVQKRDLDVPLFNSSRGHHARAAGRLAAVPRSAWGKAGSPPKSAMGSTPRRRASLAREPRGGPEPNLDGSDRTYQRWFNTAAFTAPAPGTFGDSPRTGAIRLPGVFSIDLSVNKSFRFSETRRAELRTEFLQLPNHYNIDPVRWIAGSAR